MWVVRQRFVVAFFVMTIFVMTLFVVIAFLLIILVVSALFMAVLIVGTVVVAVVVAFREDVHRHACWQSDAVFALDFNVEFHERHLVVVFFHAHAHEHLQFLKAE